MAKTILRGLTWNHPRGRDPLLGSILRYKVSVPDVEVRWELRDLSEFGCAPLEQLTERYDMIVFDHPHVGEAAEKGYFADLLPHLTPEDTTRLAAESVGPAWPSYVYDGGIWGIPVDIAAQVAAYRPDLMERLDTSPPKSWEGLQRLAARARRVGLSIIVPANSVCLSCLVPTFAASLGHPPADDAETYMSADVAEEVLGRIQDLLAICHPASLTGHEGIVLPLMVEGDEIAYTPFAFGYVTYARPDSSRQLRVTGSPALLPSVPSRTLAGGAGIGISRHSRNLRAALAYALHVSSPDYQRTSYVEDGGQPYARAAWTDPDVNHRSLDFFSDTLGALDRSYLRPRFSGYVPFFDELGRRIQALIAGETSRGAVIAWMADAYRRARTDNKTAV